MTGPIRIGNASGFHARSLEHLLQLPLDKWAVVEVVSYPAGSTSGGRRPVTEPKAGPGGGRGGAR